MADELQMIGEHLCVSNINAVFEVVGIDLLEGGQ
jgi:hypothetical protein